MSQKTPLQVVTEKHGGKDKLVDKLVGMVDRAEGEDKDAIRARLLTVSNKKLLKLAQNAEQLKASHGSRDKLLDAVMAGLGRTKDADYKKKLSTWTSNRLLDLSRTLDKRAKANGGAAPAAKAAAPKAAKAAAPKAAKAAAPKAASKAPAKKAPAKKPSKS